MRLRVRVLLAKYLLADSIAVLRARIFNPLRLVLGRKPQVVDAGCLRVLAGHFFGTNKIEYLARGATPTDGAGFHIFLTMAAMSFSDLIGAKYVHVPFSEIKHADRPMDSYAQGWNEAFHPETEPGDPEVNPDAAVAFIELYNHETFITIFNRLLYDELAARRAGFRRAFQASAERQDWGPQTIRIAVHFRQGDVGPDRNDFMWIDPATVSTSIEQVRLILESLGLKPKLVLVSNGRSPHLEALGCDFDLELVGADTLQSFAALASADVIIMAKSYFSYCAAYFSNAVCIFRPWDSIPAPEVPAPKPLSEWICSAPDGSFDRAAFLHELRRRGLTDTPSAATAS